MTDMDVPPPDHGPDAFASKLLRGPLTAAVAALCLAQLATWAPHYLTWPWYPDHDVFATMARSWDAGLRPYRDLSGNNFPGAIYMHWAVGKAFGWGRTAPFYALDALLVAGFGLALLAWSRRRFGAALPGAIGYATFLGYYLTLDYSLAAQRDWHAPLFAALGLMAAGAWPGRAGRIAAALGFVAALALRPQPIVLLPALLSALDEGARAPAEPLRKTARAALECGLILAALLAVAFAPLAWSGLLGEFARGVRLTAYGQDYNRVGVASFAKELAVPLLSLKVVAVPALVALMLPSAPPGLRRAARTWLLAFLGALLYKAISPQPHAYLNHPLMVAWAINAALLAQMLRTAPGATPTFRLAALLLALGLGATIRPRFCNPKASLDALPSLARGEPPAAVPPGYALSPFVHLSARYDWRDYRAVLGYLRAEVPPPTRLANALMAAPALTGPSALLPAFPAESTAWLRMVRPGDAPAFAASLERTPDSVVVWSPSEVDADPHLRRLAPVIRRLYRPSARFGAIEVWRRGSDDSPVLRTAQK